MAAVEVRREIRGAKAELPSNDDHGLLSPSAVIVYLTRRKCSGSRRATIGSNHTSGPKSYVQLE
jgi:hypothetical protein